MAHWRMAVVLVGVALGPAVAQAAPEGTGRDRAGRGPHHARHDAPAGAARRPTWARRSSSRWWSAARISRSCPRSRPRCRSWWRRRSGRSSCGAGVKFHNGEDFNADSVKFSIERLVNPANKLRGSSSFAPIDRVEIVDPYTVRVHTKKPWPVFVSHIALRQAAMYPPKEYAGKDPAAISRNPIGTGPYKFVRWSKDEEIVMEAFPGYWAGRPRSRPSCSSRSPTTRCGWPRCRTARSTWR